MGRRKPTHTRRPRQDGSITRALERTLGDLFPPGTIVQLLADSTAQAHTAALAEGMAHRPSLTALRAGRVVAVAHTRPLYTGTDAEKGIEDLSLLAAAAAADCVVLSWETCDVKIACSVPLDAPDEAPGLQGFRPQWHTPVQSTNSPVIRPIQRAMEQSFAQRAAVAPSGLDATVVWMQGHSYTVSLIDARPPAETE